MSRIGASIRDVARETGLSTATISRVINGRAKVSETTRARVLEACTRLDYVPNPAARALSTRRSRAVAAIIPTLEHSVFAKFIAAIEPTLGTRVYSLNMAISNADEAEELTAARKLLGMGADAFILSGLDHSSVRLDMLGRRDVPYLFTSVWDADSDPPTIGYDNAALAAQAMHHLSAKGHERVAVILGPLAESNRTRARQAWALSMADRFDHVACFEVPLSVAGGKACVQTALADTRRFSVFLCSSDVLAQGAYYACAEAGLHIPQDVSVMGFDNLDWASDIVPPLTTIDLPAAGMGEEAARQIIDFLEVGTPMRGALLPARIIERGSVANWR